MDDATRLVEFVREGNLLVLTGAGCSTESGIPDYRGPETRRRAKNPIQYRAFLTNEATRRRYWARAVVGWTKFRAARPNPAHHALATLEREGFVRGLITQNVDRLHHSAGSLSVVELHGALADVRCLECGARESRESLQRRLLALNPGFDGERAAAAPDGDAEFEGASIEGFHVAMCERCGGPLKPDVVFFGESVPVPRVERAYRMLDEARALLVVGSSLAVFSGFRFVKRAADQGKRVAIVNLGESRGDPYASLNVQARAGEVLAQVASRLSLKGS